MKYLLTLVVIVPSLCFAQVDPSQIVSQSNPNFRLSADSVNLLNIEKKRDYLRWEMFWNARASNDFYSNNYSSFYPAQRAMRAFSQSPLCNGVSGSSNWTPLGPFGNVKDANNIPLHNLGMASSFLYDLNQPDFAMVGTVWGGAFRTFNFTSPNPTWENVLTRSGFPQVGISSIVSNPSNNNEVFMAVGNENASTYGYGILHCPDISATIPQWDLINPFQITDANPNLKGNFTIYKLLIKSTSNGGVLIYAVTPKGIFEIIRQLNGTQSFYFYEIPGTPAPNLKDLEWDPNDPSGDNVFVSGDGIWHFDASTGFWQHVLQNTAQHPIVNCKLAADNGKIFALSFNPNLSTQSDKFGDIWEKGSSANIWLNYETSISCHSFNQVFEVNNSASTPVFYFERGINSLLPITLRTIVRKVGTGSQQSFSNYQTSSFCNGTSTHGDIREIFLIKGNIDYSEDVLLVGTDGGILFTNHPGSSTCTGPDPAVWLDKNGTGFISTLIYDLGRHESSPDYLLGGIQDNSYFEYSNGQWVWRWLTGDGSAAVTKNLCGDRFYIYDYQPGGNGELNTRYYNAFATSSVPMNTGYLPSELHFPIFNHPGTGYTYIGHHDLKKFDGSNCSSVDSPIGFLNISTLTGVPPCTPIRRFKISEKNPAFSYLVYSGPTYNVDSDVSDVCDLLPDPPQNYPVIKNRLFRSSDGGQSYTDISTNLNPIIWWGISDIIIDEDDPDHVWITFHGFGNEFDFDLNGDGDMDDVVYRVFEGRWNGAEMDWTDISEGLPGFPVNCIVQEKGKNDALYVGTDVGVFYRNRNMQQWECFNTNLPIGIISDLEIDYCKQRIIAATFGNGIWESNLRPSADKTLEISTTTNWEGYHVVNTNVVVKSGSTLNIRSGIVDGRYVPTTVYMSKGKTITVEPGAKLIVNDATVTCSCGFWEGIIVMGDQTKSQYQMAQNGFLHQGFVSVINNGTIEHANEGIRLRYFDANLNYWVHTGGIVQINNGVFRDNWRSIEFLQYHNVWSNQGQPLSGTEILNRSYVENSSFEITDKFTELTNDPNRHPYAFISLYDNYGIRITNNEFEDKRTSSPAVTPNNRSYGILSLDAGYSVTANCAIPLQVGQNCPTNQLNGNSFKQLFAGIYTLSSTGADNIKVDANTIENCVYGIKFDAGNYGRITRNTFDVPFANGSFTNYFGAFGIQSISGFGNSIEENTFRPIQGTGVYSSLGIHAFNSDAVAGTMNIYRNNFGDPAAGPEPGLTTGIQSSGNNLNLAYDCNRHYRNTSTVSDFHFASGVLGNQGQCILTASEAPNANEYYYASCGNTAGQALLWQNFSFTANDPQYNSYSHASVNFAPNCANWINALDCGASAPPYNRATACPVVSTLNPGDWYVNVLSKYGKWQLAKFELKTRSSGIDAGNTDSLLQEVQTQNLNTIRPSLDQIAPYLSNWVLMALVQRVNSAASAQSVYPVLDACKPLGDEVLMMIVKKQGAFTPVQLRNLLVPSAPFGKDVFLSLLQFQPPFPSAFLYDVALANSPLYNAELIALIERKPALSNAHLLQVLLKNTPLQPEVYSALSQRHPAFPPPFWQQVQQSSFVAAHPRTRVRPLSAMDVLNGELAYYEKERLLNLNGLVSHYLDSMQIDSAVHVLTEDNSIYAICALVPIKIRKGDISGADVLLTWLDGKAVQMLSINPDSKEGRELLEFVNFHNAVKQVRSRPGGYYTLSPGEIQQLEQIAVSNNMVSMNARAILDFLGFVRRYDPPEEYEQNYGSRSQQMIVDQLASENISIKVIPNPNNGQFSIDLTGLNETTRAQLQVMDLMGRKVHQQELNGTLPEMTLDDLPNGVYLIALVRDGNVIQTTRFVIAK